MVSSLVSWDFSGGLLYCSGFVLHILNLGMVCCGHVVVEWEW